VLNLNINDQIKKNIARDHSNIIEKYTNKFIKDITEYLEKFNYNKIIAKIHEMHSFFAKNLKNGFTKETLKTNYTKILIVMTPVIPHFTSECLKNLKVDLSDISWPNINEKILIEDQASFVIQVNGKTRGIIKGPIHSTEKEIINMIIQDKNLKKYIDQKEIQRKIFIPKRLLNIIV